MPGLSNVCDHKSFSPNESEAAEPSASATFAVTGSPPPVLPIKFSQVTVCPTVTCRVGGANPPNGRTTMRDLFILKSNVAFVAPSAELAMISTGRMDEFTVGATEIPRVTSSWFPTKVSSLGLIAKVTPGIGDDAESVRLTGLAVVSSWLILIE